MFVRLVIIWIALLPVILWADFTRGHVFHMRWSAQDGVECGKALLRIQQPYRIWDSKLGLLDEGGRDGGEFEDVGLRNVNLKTLKTIIARFRSLKDSTELAKIIGENKKSLWEEFRLKEFLPEVVRNPLMAKTRAAHALDFSPNCLGAAMGWFGFSNQWYHLDHEQFETLLKRFVRIRQGGDLNPETLVVWRYAGDRSPFHAAILLNRDVIWQRAGSNPAAFSYFRKAINSYGGRNGGRGDAIIEFYKVKE